MFQSSRVNAKIRLFKLKSTSKDLYKNERGIHFMDSSSCIAKLIMGRCFTIWMKGSRQWRLQPRNIYTLIFPSSMNSTIFQGKVVLAKFLKLSFFLQGNLLLSRYLFNSYLRNQCFILQILKTFNQTQNHHIDLAKQEADLLYNLDHPNIVKVYHLIQFGGILYMGMELLECGQLTNYIQ